jgi:3-hydroxyisobutyrate dehydrogenase-like beta-hydroxyacid dehydrogenase
MAGHRKIQRIGVVGLGKMGLPMARHLAAQEFDVAGYDIRADLATIAREAGFTPVLTPAALAITCDLIIVMVAFDSQVEAILFGHDGILAEAAGESDNGLIIAIASTVPASYVRSLPDRAQALGKRVSFIDIPVTGAEKAAEEGTLLVLGGGDKAVFDHCRPALNAVAREVLHLGDLGAGQVTKMVNNQILWACVSANYEGMKLAQTMGVDPEALRQALLKSSAQNWALQTRADERPLPWAEKDMMVVLQEADRARVSLPLAGTVKEVIKGFKIDRGLPMPTADD